MGTAVHKDLSVIERHPCFNVAAHKKHGRIHLPVAPKCNIQCRYCVRKFDCVNESRPGVVSQKLSPEQAVRKVLEQGFRTQDLARTNPEGLTVLGTHEMGEKVRETVKTLVK